MLLYIFICEKYSNILAEEMTSRGNRHCASCVGTVSFTIAFRRERRYAGGAYDWAYLLTTPAGRVWSVVLAEYG